MKRNTFRKVLMAVSLMVFLYCLFNIFKTLNTYETANNEYENLIQNYTSNTSTEIIPNNSLLNESIVQESESTETKSTENVETTQEIVNTYKTIDFDSLISLNSDTIGWITIPGTVIDYPIVLSHDNNEYLNLTFLKEKNSSGTLFVDRRNSGDFSDYNTLLYGHNMKNGTMFSQLRNYKDENFYEEHKYIQIYTPYGANTYAIISCYATTKTSDAYKLNFANQEEYENWLEQESKLSKYKTYDYNPNLNTITLSTCNGPSGSELRWIVHLQKIY